jgi:hypothetical protein
MYWQSIASRKRGFFVKKPTTGRGNVDVLKWRDGWNNRMM